MKLVTYEAATPFGPQRRLGALIDGQQDGRIADLTLAYATYLANETDETQPDGLAKLRLPPDMIGWLEGGHKARDAAEDAVAYVKRQLTRGDDVRGRRGEQLLFQRSAVRLLSPLPRPRSFRDYSTYEEHGSRARGDDPTLRRYKPPSWYRWPAYYKGNPDSFYGPEDPIPFVYYSKRFDLEPEIGIVIGREGRNLSFDEARDCIAGYTILIDCSDRGGPGNALGPAKSKDFATMLGPCLVTADEIDETNLKVRVSVDGELWWEGSTSMARNFLAHHLVAYTSDNETVHPGDLLGTGTIGWGDSTDLHKWVQVGQTYTLEVEGIGYLSHKIVAGEHVVDYVGSGMEPLIQPYIDPATGQPYVGERGA
jgi:2-keto-4-pentenoate hydratase/2-oxohepta-3-ene-1,7-dioic acid hydratase in catechol pathway